MKHHISKILPLFLTLCLCLSCSKATDNGPLDGMWNLRQKFSKISAADSHYTLREDCQGQGIYWRFQLDLLYITSNDALNGKTGETFARFNYTGRQLSVTSTYIHYRDRDSLLTDPATTVLEQLGIRSNATTYNVVQLSSHNMVLCSEMDSLVFKKL